VNIVRGPGGRSPGLSVPLASASEVKYAARFDEMADARHLAGDVAGFERWARLACATAKDLAPYQSPTYRAVVITPPPDKPGDDVRVIDLKIFYHTGTALGMAGAAGEPKVTKCLKSRSPSEI
jgi:hypothetical protein